MDEAAARVDQARESLKRSVANWNRSDSGGMEDCRQELERAVAQICLLQAAVADSPERGGASLRSQLTLLKTEIVAAAQGMDSAAAFYRAIAVGRAAEMESYTADGQAVTDGGRVENELQA